MDHRIALAVLLVAIAVVGPAEYYAKKKLRMTERGEAIPIALEQKINRLKIAAIIMMVVAIGSNIFYMVTRH